MNQQEQTPFPTSHPNPPTNHTKNKNCIPKKNPFPPPPFHIPATQLNPSPHPTTTTINLALKLGYMEKIFYFYYLYTYIY